MQPSHADQVTKSRTLVEQSEQLEKKTVAASSMSSDEPTARLGEATLIDDATSPCFNTYKAPCDLIGEAPVRGGKYYFSVTKDDASSKSNRKSPNSEHEKANDFVRKRLRRPKTFNSEDWYEKAAVSMAISGKP